MICPDCRHGLDVCQCEPKRERVPEVLLWTPIDEGTTVMGANPKWSECSGCYLEEGEWFGMEGSLLSEERAAEMGDDWLPPTAWAPWPAGPEF